MKKKSVRALSLFMALALIMSVMLVPSSNVFATGTSKYTYTVTYSPNGGSGSNRSYSVAANTYHTVSNQGFTRSGYVFSGWNTRADGYGTTYQNGSYICVTGNITLYAQWKTSGGTPTPNPRKVTYHPNGGNGSQVSVSVPMNTNHTVLSQGYTRSGYTFAGYNTASNGTGTAYQVGSNLYVTTDITLFAIWKTSGGTPTPNPRKVTYHPNGGNGSQVSVSVPMNTNHTVLSQGYTRSGYTFAGYNTASNGTGTSYQVGSNLYVTTDITLFAIWKTSGGPVTPNPRKVTYHPNGGNGSQVSVSVPINTNHTVLSQGYTRSGYTFAGYNTASNGTGTAYQVGSNLYVTTDITLFAMWNTAPVQPRTVTYHPNGGSGSQVSVSVPINTNHTVLNQGYTRAGYTFAGYNTASNGTGITYQVGSNLYVTNDITLFAMWTVAPIPPRTVTYHPNGGNGTEVSVSVPINTNHTVLSQGYTRSGYTFAGYNTASNGTGTSYQVGSNLYVTTDITLFAMWQIEQFTITYSSNGGNEPDRTYTVGAFSSHTIFDQGFTRGGYTFVEWNTRADGTGNALNNGQAFWVYSDITLYAQWSRNPQRFTVTYDANGGTGGLIDTDILEGSDYFVKTAQETNVLNPQHNFWYWYTRPDSLDPTGVSFQPGDKLEMDRDYYLYVIWRTIE